MSRLQDTINGLNLEELFELLDSIEGRIKETEENPKPIPRSIGISSVQVNLDLGKAIQEYGGLTNHLSFINANEYPKHLRKKLMKFMDKYDKIYELLRKEGIQFDYSR